MSDLDVSPADASRDILAHASLLESAGRVIVSAKITWPAEIPVALERHGLRVVRVKDTDSRLRAWLANSHGPCIVLLSGGADVTAWHWRTVGRDEPLYDPRRVVEVYLIYSGPTRALKPCSSGQELGTRSAETIREPSFPWQQTSAGVSQEADGQDASLLSLLGCGIQARCLKPDSTLEFFEDSNWWTVSISSLFPDVVGDEPLRLEIPWYPVKIPFDPSKSEEEQGIGCQQVLGSVKVRNRVIVEFSANALKAHLKSALGWLEVVGDEFGRNSPGTFPQAREARTSMEVVTSVLLIPQRLERRCHINFAARVLLRCLYHDERVEDGPGGPTKPVTWLSLPKKFKVGKTLSHLRDGQSLQLNAFWHQCTPGNSNARP
ncbi:MAG: hypothetical protein BIFFINMI_04271 [Phycisphaerae bacterium]|nr:hypothetical protein [Phycisphaerae bacterium]